MLKRAIMNQVHNITIKIADIVIKLLSPLPAIKLGISQRLGLFLDMPGNPISQVLLRCENNGSPLLHGGKLIYDPGSIWKMYRRGSNFYAIIKYPNLTEGVLQTNLTWDNLILKECNLLGKPWSLLNSGAGELIIRTAILFNDGLMFHSSGLDDNGKGIVFVGHSGAGKSTQLDLWSKESGVIAMNDDRVAVRVIEGNPICYGTPWSGSSNIACNHSAPLSALILLEQAPENEIRQLSPSTSASLLLVRAFLPYWDRDLMGLALENLNKILSKVPVFLLRCRPEPEVIPLVRSVL
jgi:hypothetical protein